MLASHRRSLHRRGRSWTSPRGHHSRRAARSRPLALPGSFSTPFRADLCRYRRAASNRRVVNEHIPMNVLLKRRAPRSLISPARRGNPAEAARKDGIAEPHSVCGRPAPLPTRGGAICVASGITPKAESMWLMVACPKRAQGRRPEDARGRPQGSDLSDNCLQGRLCAAGRDQLERRVPPRSLFEDAGWVFVPSIIGEKRPQQEHGFPEPTPSGARWSLAGTPAAASAALRFEDRRGRVAS
jgi:hypothetical protein